MTSSSRSRSSHLGLLFWPRTGQMALTVCNEPGCINLTERGRCTDCKRQAELKRGRPADRGYDKRWRRIRAEFLRENPDCVDCGDPATVADHDPVSRRDLMEAGVANPDDHAHLKARCASCHSSRTAVAQPGGWNGAAR
jgi:5-methylcytosine-specific restriction enzyme A